MCALHAVESRQIDDAAVRMAANFPESSLVLISGRPRTDRGMRRISASAKDSEILRLRSLVAALAATAEHPGETAGFIKDALDTVIELTRATGGVVLLEHGEAGIEISCARGQMKSLTGDAYSGGETLAHVCLLRHAPQRSDAVADDPRIGGSASARVGIHALIATPLRYGEEILGVLEVCSSVPHAFDDVDAQAVALIGSAMGAALGRQLALEENARLVRRLHDALLDTQATARMYQDAASLDSLTGIPNRPAFESQLNAACEVHAGQPERFGVLFLDLDGFKQINDTHGHAMGDEVLRATASSLQETVRDSDLVARLGGDEFVVLLSKLRHGDRDVMAVAAAVEDELARPRLIKGERMRIKCSVGWVLHDGVATAAEVLRAADAHMYANKRARRAVSSVE